MYEVSFDNVEYFLNYHVMLKVCGDFFKSKKKQKYFKYGTSDNHTIVEDTVTAHVRCSTGDGPIDQIRL